MSAWRVAAASVRGTSHARLGLPCQDRHACVIARGDVLVAVVSDGAGSASHAEHGAELVCDRFVALAGAFLADGGALPDEARVRDWVRDVHLALVARAGADGLPVTAFHCTLLAAVMTVGHAVFIQLGDGAVVVADGAGWRCVHWPQRGEYANATFFATDPAAHERVAVDVVSGDVPEVALFTDGIEALVLHYATRSAHAAFFDGVFPPVRASAAEGMDAALSAALGAYLGSRAVCERTDDDTTLVLATRAPR